MKLETVLFVLSSLLTPTVFAADAAMIRSEYSSSPATFLSLNQATANDGAYVLDVDLYDVSEPVKQLHAMGISVSTSSKGDVTEKDGNARITSIDKALPLILEVIRSLREKAPDLRELHERADPLVDRLERANLRLKKREEELKKAGLSQDADENVNALRLEIRNVNAALRQWLKVIDPIERAMNANMISFRPISSFSFQNVSKNLLELCRSSIDSSKFELRVYMIKLGGEFIDLTDSIVGGVAAPITSEKLKQVFDQAPCVKR